MSLPRQYVHLNGLNLSKKIQIESIIRKNEVNASKLDIKAGRVTKKYQFLLRNLHVIVYYLIMSLLYTKKEDIEIHDDIYLYWSTHDIKYYAEYRHLGWNYKKWQIPINITFKEFCSILTLIKTHEVGILRRDSYAIYFEFFLINKILTSYMPSTVAHLGTICRRSLILSDLCIDSKLVIIQHGFLNYDNCYFANIDTFIRDERFPEQNYERYFNFKNGLNTEIYASNEKDKKSLVNVFALSPNYTAFNIKTLWILFFFSRKNWVIFCHPRNNQYIYHIICFFSNQRFRIEYERNVQINFLITFKSSLIQQHYNEEIKIILLDYKKLHYDITSDYPNIKIINTLRELKNV